MPKSREELRAYNREWAKTHYDPERNRRMKLKAYGLTPAEFNTLLFQQGSVCAVCRKPNSNARPLCVDHNHGLKKGDPGFVRGLLCDKCNQAVGLLDDSSDRMRTLAAYVEGV